MRRWIAPNLPLIKPRPDHPRHPPPRRFKRRWLWSATAGLLLAAVLVAFQPRSAALVAAGAASALLLALLDRLRNRLTPVALRAAADLVLLTPLLLTPFARLPQ